MIAWLGITILILVVVLWIVSMYFSWKLSQGLVPRTLSPEAIVASATDKTVRLGRRGLYATERMAKKAYTWTEKQARHGFVKIVPSAKEAFAPKQPATTTSAPSEFLVEVAAAKKGATKRLSRTKKML